MNKKTLKALVLALAVLFPMQNVFADYCTSLGNSTHTARYLNAFTLTDGTNEAVVSDIQTSTKQAVYQDKTSVVLETEAGATISFSSITWNGEWMHGYAFADFNNDGTFDSSDVVSYNFYSTTDAASGENSKGETVSNNCNVTAANMPEWTIPSDLAPGDYRFRFKVDWNSLDPCGASDIAGNGGAAVDMTIRIASQAAARTISVSVNPAETGTVTINGEEVSEVTAEGGITLIATPAEGYKFVNWTLNGEEVSTNAKFVDGTEGDKAYVANFAELETISVSVSVNDEAMGYAYASAEGSVLEGTEITLTATPAEGYMIENWTVNGEVVSEETSFTTTVTESTEFVANFKEKPNKITVASIECSEAAWGSYVIANAIDGEYSTNYESNNYPSNGTTVTVSFDTNKVLDKVVVYFSSASVPSEGKFQISSDGSSWTDIEGSSFTSSQKDSNNAITVDCKKVAAKYLRLNIVKVAQSYLKIFEFEVYGKDLSVEGRTISVSVNDEAMGTAYIGEEGVTEVANNTSALELVAVANEGYEFVNWTVNGEVVGTDATIYDTTEGDKAYVANFIALAQYTISVSVNDATMGTATADATGTLFKYTPITLTATPVEGYEFVNWTVNGEVFSDANPVSTQVTDDTEYVANFRLIPTKATVAGVEINMESGWSSATSVIDGVYDTYYYASAFVGGTVTLTLAEETLIGDIKLHFAQPAYYMPTLAKIQISSNGQDWEDVAGCSFTNESAKVNDKTGTYEVVLDAKGVSAKYVRMYIDELGYYSTIYMYEFEVFETTVELPARTISVSANDDTMGVAYIGTEGITEVSESTGAVKLIAVANEGYEFVNWTVNGEEVTTNATFLDKTEGDKAYVANFIALAKYTLSVSVNDAIMGTVEASQTGEMFKYTEVTLTATPTEGYEFVNWTVNGEEVSKLSTIKVSVEEDVEYKANFQIIPTKLALVAAEVSMDHYSSYVAGNIIDGKYNTMYDSARKQDYDNNDAYATVTLEEESLIGDVKIYFSGNYRPSKAKIQVSTDGIEWIDVEGGEFAGSDAIDASAVQSGAKLITVNCNGVSAKYVRMFITEKASAYLTMFEFEVYEAPVNVEARTISVSVNDATMGEAYIGISGVTTLEGQTGAVKMFAVASDNAYRFVNWTVDGEVVSTSASIVDRTEGDKAYVANFEAKPIYTVSVSSATAKRGSASCDAAEVVYEGDIVTFTATPTAGYGFINWTVNGEVVSEENPYALEITESVALVANFDVNPELDRSAWSIYTVSSQYAGIDGSDYVTGEKAIDGKFSTYWHTDWDNAANKKVPQWIVFDLGAVKSFDSFNYVSRAEAQDQNGNIGGYKLYVSTEAPDVNDLTGTMEVINEGTFSYPSQEHKVELGKAYSGQYVMLYATSTYGSGGTNMFANCAEFYLYLSSYSVTVSPSNPAHGTVYIETEGTTSYPCSVEGTDVVTITAVAAPKYQFVNWTLNGEVVSTEAVYTTDLVTESRAYIANFEFAPVAPRTITATVNNAAKGSVVFLAPESTESSVVSDNIVVAKAVPATTDEFFVNWTINGVEVGTEDTYEYLEEGDVTIQANFESRYVVTVAQVAGGTIYVKAEGNTIASGDRVLEGNNLTITVSENNRSELKKLFVNGEDVFLQYKYNPDFAVKVAGPTTITAEYGEPRCIVTWENIGSGYVEVWESDTYDEEADAEGTLELPVSPAGEQYAYGDEVPFLTSVAIFAYAKEGEELLALSINGDEIDLEADFYYGDYFISEIESALHIVATFTGEYWGVEEAEAETANVYAVADGIKVVTAEVANVSIYTIAGVLVSEQTVSETTTIAMEKGVYIVKVADKVAKVVVK